MKLIDELLAVVPDGETVSVTIGLHWTAVVVNTADGQRCGLASTLTSIRPHGEVDVAQAGKLEQLSGRELAALATTDNLTLRSIGVATINALLPPLPERWMERNAEHVIIEAGRGKTVARVLLLGPSTPLHPLLFDYGMEMLSGAVITAVDPVLHLIRQGAVFRQVRKGGVRLVTMT